jgi:hypothetical protein
MVPSKHSLFVPITKCILIFFTINIHLSDSATYPDSPDSIPPDQWSDMSTIFEQHCSPFGISVFAQEWPRDKFLHACNVLAQMIDNDQDGCADDVDVVKKVRSLQAGMAMFKDVASLEKYADQVSPTFNWQDLQADETEPTCSGADESGDCRDAALEEIMHVISGNGIAAVYPEDFSDCRENFSNGKSSKMQLLMDKARGGKWDGPPSGGYPDSAIYHYDDETCDYGCMATEYFYWALTSLLDGQDQRAEENMVEWEASTRSQLMEKDRGMYDLLIGGTTKMKLLSLDGELPGSGGAGAQKTYNPTSQSCSASSGCGLDGEGCGPQGNSDDIQRCESEPVTCEDKKGKVVWWNKKAGKKKCNFFKRKPNRRCRRKGAIAACPQSCNMCGKNGEEVCESLKLKKNACNAISCCQWGDGQCWSNVGNDQCFSS